MSGISFRELDPHDRYKLLFTGGLHITSTLDPTLQADAEAAVDH